ncbi:MAG: T9SS type A sorting domain-containing protein [Saprospiraceae bacterium]|nr:T9SS type A sorting domain-containing protein [Saprospiraceae bacterium]
MRLFFTFLLIFLICFDTDGQCIVTTTETSTMWNQGIGPGPSAPNGQVITVCEGGVVTSIAMSKHLVINDNTTGRLELYRSGTSFTNLIWTRDGFPISAGSNITGLSWVTIDFTIGEGISYSLNPDEAVSFLYKRTGNNFSYSFHFNATNPYSGGMMVRANFLPWNNGNNDWIMKVAMNDASLPVDFVEELWCKPENGKVVLSWTTANEINNLGFDIQRSQDGINFETIGWVDGHGNESGPIRYHFVDDLPLTGRNYYRLKQNDYDGKFDYSHITHIDIKRSGNLAIFPNPVTDILNIQIEEDETFTIYDQMMKPVKKGVIPASRQISVSDLLSGMYFLYLSERGEYERFVKG